MDRIKIAVVGLCFGRIIAEDLARGRGGDFFELAGVCDLDQERAAALAGSLNVRQYGTLDTLLADSEIPAIALMTGPAGRAGLVRKIISAGKDVMTTKPFEADPGEALAVLREAESLGRTVHMNSPAPLPTADLLQIMAWREKYNLGRPVGCRADVWSRRREKADGRWIDDPLKCPAAPITRIGIYLINDMVRLLGPAQKVHVMHSRVFTGRPTPDNAQLGILFENGVLGNVYASYCVGDGRYHRNALLLNYENGTIYRNVMPPGGVEQPKTAYLTLVAADEAGKSVMERAVCPQASGAYCWDLFYRAVKGEKLEGRITPGEVAAGIRVLAAMARADRTGLPQEVMA